MTSSTLDALLRRVRFLPGELLEAARDLRLAQTAASLAFLSLLALVPVFTIGLSLFGALPGLEPLRASLLKFLAANLLLPSVSDTVVRYLGQFAAKVDELSLVGAAAFLATAFSALLTIDRTLNRIWRVDRPRPLIRRLTVYWTLLTLGPLLLAAGLAVNGLVVSEFLTGVRARPFERAWLSLLPWFTTVAGLVLLYKVLPNASVLLRDALFGAVTAAIALDLLKRLFAFQLARLPTYKVVYGTFATLPILLIWLFAFWLVVLVGAIAAARVSDRSGPRSSRQSASPALRFALAQGVLDALLHAARHGSPTLRPSAIPALAGCRQAEIEATAQLLRKLGYLERYWRLEDDTGGDAERRRWDEHWALCEGAGAKTLRPLFEALWHAAERPDPAVPGLDLGAIDRALMDRTAVDRSARDALR